MTPSLKPLRWAAVCLIILVAVVLWRSSRSNPASSTPAKEVAFTAVPRVVTQAVVPVANASQTALVQDREAPIPLDDIKVMVRLKLKEWRETKTEDDEARKSLLEFLLGLLTRENAAEITRSLLVEELNSEFGLAAQKLWLEANPAEAARWIAAQPDATEEQARLVARQLLTDERGMSVFCDELADTAWRQAFLSVASLEALGGKEPARAAALAQRMQPGPAQTNALETVVYDWAVHDLKGAMGLVGTITEPVLRERVMAVAAKAIALGDPDLGAQWLASAVKSEGVLKETAQCVVEIWAEKNPAEAAQWLSRATDVSVRADAVNALVRAWQKTDPAAALAWVKTLPEGDQVLASLKAEQAERERGQE
jgi:hypothetical protein